MAEKGHQREILKAPTGTSESPSRLSNDRTDLIEHFVVFRKAANLVFAPHFLVVDVHIKNAAAAGNEGGRRTEFLRNRLRQTGGSREVVSLRAVFDRDGHGPVLSFANDCANLSF